MTLKSADIQTPASKATPEKPLLLVFGSPRCGHSRRAEGFLAGALQRRANHDTFSIRRIDVDARPDLASRFGVDVLPSFLVVEQKRVVTRIARPRGIQELTEVLRPWLRAPHD